MASNHQHTDWLELRRDDETGIESVNAHFQGHAYDPHDHDEMLVGVTQQGLQRFNCHRSLHTSRPGRAMLIEPGAVHDGHAPQAEGFTYAMLYLPAALGLRRDAAPRIGGRFSAGRRLPQHVDRRSDAGDRDTTGFFCVASEGRPAGARSKPGPTADVFGAAYTRQANVPTR
ncbi:AraC-like ligand binding domain [Serratia marcescens]|nr:AraC-like ligand binding domain [Serratia marcescens]